MNEAKYSRIHDFLYVWGYTLPQLLDYLKANGANTQDLAERGKRQGMNEFLCGVMGRQQAKPEPKAIPRPENTEADSIARDLWLMLGTGDDLISLDDLTEYAAERVAKTEAANLERDRKRGMEMNNMLRNLTREEDEYRRESVADVLWRRSEKIYSDKRTMNEFLANLPEVDSRPVRLTVPDVPTERDDLSDFLRKMRC